MKTLKFLIASVLFSLIFSKSCFPQQFQLSVTGITNFPVLPNDTAYEQQTDSLIINVINMDSGFVAINDTLWVFLRNTDTIYDQFPDILVSLFIDTLQGNDTFHLENGNYPYSQSTFKAGNNIVVVWPRMGINPNTTYDTLQIDTVYFVPFASVSMLNVNSEAFSIFPNPVSEEIYINSVPEKYIEYVRILNDIGQEVLFRRTFEERLDVRFLSEGFYFFEIRERNGTIIRKKFLKL